MSSALPRPSSRSIATRVMYGIALVALLAFGVAAAASYLRSSQALLTGARATMEGLASLGWRQALTRGPGASHRTQRVEPAVRRCSSDSSVPP